MRPLFNRERKNLSILKKMGFSLVWTYQNNLRRPYIAYALNQSINELWDLDCNFTAEDFKSVEEKVKKHQEKKTGLQLQIF